MAKTKRAKTKAAKANQAEEKPLPANYKPAPDGYDEPERRSWVRDHIVLVYLAAGLVLVGAIFIGIRIYQNATNPLTRFSAAASKTFSSSFRFDVEAVEDGNTVMRYQGAFLSDERNERLRAVYDADYTDYRYSAALYSEGGVAYRGNCYDGVWRVHECADDISEFFDFHSSFRSGEFDSGSFLRFMDLTNTFRAEKLDEFMKQFKSRMNGSHSMAKVSVHRDEKGGTEYRYDVNFDAFFSFVLEEGSEIFFNYSEYESFLNLYENNSDAIRSADFTVSFVVNSAGWLSQMSMDLRVGEKQFALNCTMTDFGSAVVNLPEGFREAAGVRDTGGKSRVS